MQWYPYVYVNDSYNSGSVIPTSSIPLLVHVDIQYYTYIAKLKCTGVSMYIRTGTHTYAWHHVQTISNWKHCRQPVCISQIEYVSIYFV